MVIKVNYDSSWPPKIYLVTEEENATLDAESVSVIDDMWVESVNVVLNPYEGPNGKSLYVKSMEVFQKVDDDPISSKYAKNNRRYDDSDETEDIPFN